MQNEIKAHAQITNEMRTYFAAEKHGVHYDCHDVAWHRLFAYWADNLDEAHKREVRDAAMEHAVLPAVSITKAPQGNDAKMRAALKLCMEMMCVYCTESTDETCMNGCETLRMAKAALAAPPRNCDRFTDAEDAFMAYRDTLRDGDVVSSIGYGEWLFAKAEGAE